MRVNFSKMSSFFSCRYKFMIFFLCSILYIILFSYQNSENALSFNLQHAADDIQLPQTDDFLVNTSGCRVPTIQPFHAYVRKYLANVSRIKCAPTGPLVRSNQTGLYLDTVVLREMNATLKDVSCCYYALRGNKFSNLRQELFNHSFSYEPNCYPFSNYTAVNHEFVRVVCNVTNIKAGYQDFHAFFIPKTPKKPPSTRIYKKKPSVLVVGVNSVSRLNLYRQMPRTANFLTHHDAIEFFGYNKVGDSTFSNLIPILTGYSVDELINACWPTNNAFLDNCTFLWQNYSNNGFLTAFGEDTPSVGPFLSEKRGFTNFPTDYYLQPFIKMNDNNNITNVQDGFKESCYGHRLASEILFDYVAKLAINLTKSSKPFFGWFWSRPTILSQDNMNIAPNNDEIYTKLFQTLEAENVLKKTIVIFVSDHGMRWGPFRKSYQGWLEERLPFLFILLPKWFESKFPLAFSNMLKNRRMLTSPFDLHETLKDLMNLEEIQLSRIFKRTSTSRPNRGISWFLYIPYNRTCASTGISDEWCTCHNSMSVSVKDQHVQKAALTVVARLNQILIASQKCAQLFFKRVHSVRVRFLENVVEDGIKTNVADILLIIETVPGNASFQALVRYDTYQLYNPMHVLGFISRINSYGNESSCVFNSTLKLYCYCT